MESINERMETIVNEMFKGNKAAFARAIGTDGATLSNYIGSKRRSKPSVDMIARIVTALGVDALWLLTGEGDEHGGCAGDRSVETSGDFSPASYHGDVTVGGDAVLAERVKALENEVKSRDELIKEKERLIQVLMEKR